MNNISIKIDNAIHQPIRMKIMYNGIAYIHIQAYLQNEVIKIRRIRKWH